MTKTNNNTRECTFVEWIELFLTCNDLESSYFFNLEKTTDSLLLHCYNGKLSIQDRTHQISLQKEYTATVNFSTHSLDIEISTKGDYSKTVAADLKGFIYPVGLHGVMAGTPWLYSSLESISEEAIMIAPIKYLLKYIECPAMEYLVKHKLFKVISELLEEEYPLINFSKKANRIDFLIKNTSHYLKMVSKGEVSVNILEILYTLEKHHILLSRERFYQYTALWNACIAEPANLDLVLELTSIGKFIRYLKSLRHFHPKLSDACLITLWAEYNRITTQLKRFMADTKGIDIEFPLFPKNIVECLKSVFNLSTQEDEIIADVLSEHHRLQVQMKQQFSMYRVNMYTPSNPRIFSSKGQGLYLLIYGTMKDTYHILVPSGRTELTNDEIMKEVSYFTQEIAKYEVANDTDEMLVKDALILERYNISIDILEPLPKRMILDAAKRYSIPLSESVLDTQRHSDIKEELERTFR